MNFAPIDTENKGGWLKLHEIRERSVFEYYMGRVELYMDEQVVKSASYSSKTHIKEILQGWEMWMRNHYNRHVFYIHLIPIKPL